MAKRRKLEAPSAEELSRIEAELTPRRSAAPIAAVAADSAGAHDPRDAEARIAAAKDRADAERLREAEGRGLVLEELPLELIDADALVRDRVVLDAEEMEELKASIARNGLRLPIEVFAQDGRYGLLSGYRRLKAVRELKALTGDARYDRIKSVLREPEALGGTFAAMVEENEIRASLSHYERGRIAVIAAQQGSFANVEAAVEALFPMASKAKRSKIRSFALIFEELGDMLSFPDFLREKEGLAVATALRGGGGPRLREALAEIVPERPEEEQAQLAEALAALEPPPPGRRRGGRPRKTGRAVSLASGVVLTPEQGPEGWTIRIQGDRVDRELVQVLLAELERLLDAP
jgi:ParB family chromosome partitioning protein